MRPVARTGDDQLETGGRVAGLAAGGGLVAGLVAFFAASCCALPLAFVILGLGGAWLAVFDALLVYRTEAVGLAVGAIVAGWSIFAWQRLRSAARCRATGACARPLGRLWSFRLLVAASLLAVAAWQINVFQGDITRTLIELRSWLNG